MFANAVQVMQQAGLVGIDFSPAMLWDDNDIAYIDDSSSEDDKIVPNEGIFHVDN